MMSSPDSRRAGRALLTGLTLAAFLALAPGAMAVGTVVIQDFIPPQQRLQFTDTSGDTNNITITQSGAQFTITDTGAVINESSADCTGDGTNTVVCTDPDIALIGATLNAGNDRLVNDTLVPGSVVFGGPGNDTLIGSQSTTGARESMQGGEGDDTIDGRAGADDLQGDAGIDDVSGGPDGDTVSGGADADRVSGGGGDDTFQEENDDASDDLIGGPGDDSFTLTRFPGAPGTGDDVLDGGPGIDDVSMEDFTFLFGEGPNLPARVTLNDRAANDGFGGQANTFLDIEDLSTTSTGGGAASGDDVVRGSAAGNILRTFDGADDVDGLGGADVIEVGDNDDLVEGRDGSRDRIDCGAGTDTVRADQLDVLFDCENVSVSFVQPAGTTPPNFRYELPPATLAECGPGRDVLTLGAGNDNRRGTARNDLIFAGPGNDVIDALAGDDCIDLGPGNDSGQGGAGNDLVVGGLGNDRASGSTGNDRLRGDAGDDRLAADSGNDDLRGGSGRDRLAGGAGSDRMHGQSSNDSLTGAGGSDRINGGSGGDGISGGGSSDRIAADQGSDRVTGGGGRDVLKGNSGNDRISARDGARDRISCGTGRDRVTADRVDSVARDCERVRRRG